MRTLPTALAALVLMGLVTGCASPAQMAAEKRADQRERCAGYGYAPGSDRFADCMMQQDMRAERDERRQADQIARYRQLSLERSGDDRYPVCSAAGMDNHLDVEGFWYGPGCRAR